MTRDIKGLALLLKALSDPNRLQIVLLLADHSEAIPHKDCHCGPGPMCVNAMTERLGMTQSAVSQHLRILRLAGIVHGEKIGVFVHYTLDRNVLIRATDTLQKILGLGSTGRK